MEAHPGHLTFLEQVSPSHSGPDLSRRGEVYSPSLPLPSTTCFSSLTHDILNPFPPWQRHWFGCYRKTQGRQGGVWPALSLRGVTIAEPEGSPGMQEGLRWCQKLCLRLDFGPDALHVNVTTVGAETWRMWFCIQRSALFIRQFTA